MTQSFVCRRRRASYYWLLEVLDTYKPLVWEYSRLNITNNVLSKRKLNKLVTDSLVLGWDDPRLYTLSGLRRRGATSTSINNFCREIGITRNENYVPTHKLEHHIRTDLDLVAPRALAVLRPLKVGGRGGGGGLCWLAKIFHLDGIAQSALGKDVRTHSSKGRNRWRSSSNGVVFNGVVLGNMA